MKGYPSTGPGKIERHTQLLRSYSLRKNRGGESKYCRGPGTLLQALESAEVRKEGNNCSYGRVKCQEEQRSESVNEKPRSHTCRTPRCTKCCGVEVSRMT